MESIAITVAITISILLPLAAIMQRRVNERGGCPECGFPVPMFRRPRSLRQALWGGWTCKNCEAELDRQSRQVSA